MGMGFSCKWVGLIYVLVISLLNFPAFADETGEAHQHERAVQHNADIERMLVLMRVPDLVNQTAAEVIELYAAKITGENVDSNTKKLVTAYQKDLESIVSRVLSWDAIKSNYIKSYASRMSKLEVQAVIQFFESTHGQAFISHQTSATEELKQTTKHLVEADLSDPLNTLSAQLRAGLAKINDLPDNN